MSTTVTDEIPRQCDCIATKGNLRDWAVSWKRGYSSDMLCPVCDCPAGVHHAGRSHEKVTPTQSTPS
jgi:hypothetical protein